MTGSKHTRRKSKRSKSLARKTEPEGHDSSHTQESTHTHSQAHGSEPMVREDHGVPSKPVDYTPSGYKRCHYRGIWNPCCCLCCKDKLKCGCIVFGALTIVGIIPLLANCVYAAIIYNKLPHVVPYKRWFIMSVFLSAVSIICFAIEGILSLVAVLKRLKTGIYAYIIIGIVVWILMQLLVVIITLLWWDREMWAKSDVEAALKPNDDITKEQLDYAKNNPHTDFELFAPIPGLFFLLLFMWPYSIVTHAVLWKRHVELGSGDMVRDDGV